MPKIFSKEYKGFTLIELLIVIAIIGILSVAFLPVLRGGQGKARDAARVSLLENIATVIEEKYNGGTAIPVDGAPACLSFAAAGAGTTLSGWLNGAPKVPAKGPGFYACAGGVAYYTYKSNGDLTAAGGTATNYALLMQMENPENTNISEVTAPTDDTFAGLPVAIKASGATGFKTFTLAKGLKVSTFEATGLYYAVIK